MLVHRQTGCLTAPHLNASFARGARAANEIRANSRLPAYEIGTGRCARRGEPTPPWPRRRSFARDPLSLATHSLVRLVDCLQLLLDSLGSLLLEHNLLLL